MPQDAIIGARYKDDVFDAEFTIVSVRAETDSEIASEDEILVEMSYDGLPDTITVSLDEFRAESEIEVIEVPDHEA